MNSGDCFELISTYVILCRGIWIRGEYELVIIRFISEKIIWVQRELKKTLVRDNFYAEPKM